MRKAKTYEQENFKSNLGTLTVVQCTPPPPLLILNQLEQRLREKNKVYAFLFNNNSMRDVNFKLA